MAKKQFKAESKRLLDMMINSIYTHKEIFLRELISNASDAIDKLYFRSLTDDSVKLKKKDFFIRLAADKENRTLTVRDNGIGMTKEELEKNLGTIAKSGSLDFKNENETGGKVRCDRPVRRGLLLCVHGGQPRDGAQPRVRRTGGLAVGVHGR